ncbi:membrane protein [Xenorhabdus khoisanae]|uniref:Membrane protein n=1 Tax=Xenorhabdus khoisanae TaxID=880157 RepID=A0A0J5FQ62_9GAMM|nr:membrane protein [Xenorhabdus khoisanae]KMJ44067.1 membrane protein [Xenorhabdus khoisanae]
MVGKGLPRGIRNHNPGNLEIGSPWQGLTKKPQDIRFCSFVDAAYGIRALAVTLITYHDKRKATNGTRIDTVRKVIERWAPSVENHTERYIQFVSKAMGVYPDQNINLHDYDTICPLVEAIIRQENGRGKVKTLNSWYSREVIDEGLRRAGIIKKTKEVVKIPVTKETASATVAASLGIGQIAEVMPQISDAMMKSESHLSSGSVVRITFGVATIVVACVIAYAQIKRHKNGN